MSQLLNSYHKLRVLPTRSNNSTKTEDNVYSTFTCFEKLPIELRLKIWRVACFRSRNVDIWITRIRLFSTVDLYHTDAGYDKMSRLSYFKSGSPPPVVLHCCQESRQEGLKHYKLSFGFSHTVKGGLTFAKDPRIYINWEADRLCLMNPDTYDVKSSENFFDLLKHEGLTDLAIAVDLRSSLNGRCRRSTLRSLPLSETIKPWLCGILDLILFPSIHWDENDKDWPSSVTAKTLIEHGPGITMHWKPFAKEFAVTNIMTVVENSRDKMYAEITMARNLQELIPSRLVTSNPGPEITVSNHSFIHDEVDNGIDLDERLDQHEMLWLWLTTLPPVVLLLCNGIPLHIAYKETFSNKVIQHIFAKFLISTSLSEY
ncbi:uncharacterized protein LY89DRAFT_732513 [Mollisia scopiformis]|uniref:2EXR domain-containing protein n=1 Tax=Mollisia scopiformis TaxID=149040 RepID=A0A194XFN9_MOLSC|nr:uncharacterized protein LY89DRAFT_732513 [Mollisia scopiformis]KUJ18983.1 hypothetical protein LY89DRAFT_732513 [Mollisia scopiformis]